MSADPVAEIYKALSDIADAATGLVIKVYPSGAPDDFAHAMTRINDAYRDGKESVASLAVRLRETEQERDEMIEVAESANNDSEALGVALERIVREANDLSVAVRIARRALDADPVQGRLRDLREALEPPAAPADTRALADRARPALQPAAGKRASAEPNRCADDRERPRRAERVRHTAKAGRMIGLLVRALAQRAAEIAEWEQGFKPDLEGPRPVGTNQQDFTGSGTTVEFRLRVNGPTPTVYVVTISEIRER